MLDCKIKARQLRFRGIPEKGGEVSEQTSLVLAEFLGKTEEEIETHCDDIYRVNSEYARKKNIYPEI